MKDESPKDKLKEQQEQAKPLLDAFFAWAKSLRNIAPKSKLGKAVNYLIEEEPYLRRYIEDGRLEIDNNVQREVSSRSSSSERTGCLPIRRRSI